MEATKAPKVEHWFERIAHCVIVFGLPHAVEMTALGERTLLRCESALRYIQNLAEPDYLLVLAVTAHAQPSGAHAAVSLMWQFFEERGVPASRIHDVAYSVEQFSHSVERVLQFIALNRLERATLHVASTRYECWSAAIMCRACWIDRVGKGSSRHFSPVHSLYSGETESWSTSIAGMLDLAESLAYWCYSHPISPRRMPPKVLSS